MTKTREDYGSRIARQKFNKKARFELKGQFLKELRDNTFSGTNGEDPVEYIEKFLEIVDLVKIPNVTHNQLRLSNLPISLTRTARKWLEDEPYGSITTWVDLTKNFFGKFNLPSHTSRKKEASGVNIKNALWDYWRRGDDEEVLTDNELFNLGDENLIKENEIAQIFRIDTDIFHLETPLCEAFKEFNYLLKIDVDVLTKDIPRFKTYEEYKDDWIYEWNNGIPWVNVKPWSDDGVWT
uniref:Reverse transcriptase domain-containing protein n=1 Tax=Tanacetum cinerariifolium TaxID=118510 RepID=A0A699GSZ6_TANCI|nr:hypothetical protein [Tanacetum cinerariifolium]